MPNGPLATLAATVPLMAAHAAVEVDRGLLGGGLVEYLVVVGLLVCALWCVTLFIKQGERQGYSRTRMNVVGYGTFLVVSFVAIWVSQRLHG